MSKTPSSTGIAASSLSTRYLPMPAPNYSSFETVIYLNQQTPLSLIRRIDIKGVRSLGDTVEHLAAHQLSVVDVHLAPLY